MMCMGFLNFFSYFQNNWRNIDIYNEQSYSNEISLFFSLNVMQTCRTSKLSDYRANFFFNVKLLACSAQTSVTTHFEKLRLFEKKFQSAYNFWPSQRTLKFFFKVRCHKPHLETSNRTLKGRLCLLQYYNLKYVL